jgi:hypothetical protein
METKIVEIKRVFKTTYNEPVVYFSNVNIIIDTDDKNVLIDSEMPQSYIIYDYNFNEITNTLTLYCYDESQKKCFIYLHSTSDGISDYHELEINREDIHLVYKGFFEKEY